MKKIFPRSVPGMIDCDGERVSVPGAVDTRVTMAVIPDASHPDRIEPIPCRGIATGRGRRRMRRSPTLNQTTMECAHPSLRDDSMKKSIKLLFGILLVCLLCVSVMAASPDADCMDELGQRAAVTAMDQLKFSKGDPNVFVLTNAGRAVVDGQTTERAVAGITKVSGLQNGDNTLWQVNRANWNPLWFYFYNKKSGEGIYLEPDAACYTKSSAALKATPLPETFSKVVVVTGDLEAMLANTEVGNATMKDLGGASSVVPIANAWAHGAPYDLMSAAMHHDHLCPGLLGGYLNAKYVEKVLPITGSASYVPISSPSTSCKEDIFPILWDITAGKGGHAMIVLSGEERDALREEYGSAPRGIFVRWDNRARSGTGVVLGSAPQTTSVPYTGPSWGEKPSRVLEILETLDEPEKHVMILRMFTVDSKTLADLKNPANNPYKVIRDLPSSAVLPNAERMDELGQRAASLAMEQLKFSKGDPNVLVLTNAGRAVVDGQSTERVISGITKVSGLQNGDSNLWQVNRANWNPLWFYFYNKKSGKAIYLEPDVSCYTKSSAELKATSLPETFSKVVVVTGDLKTMLANTEVGNATMKDLGGASSMIPIANAWAHGAPYDLMASVMLHDHFCPGVSSGYLLAKYVEQEMPITGGTSYVVISCPMWCKEDVFPILWDLTAGKGGRHISPLSEEDEATMTEKYGTRPAGIFIRWDSKQKMGHALALGFEFDSTPWTGPSWGEKPSQTVEMVENIGNPGKYVRVMKEFDVDERMLSDMKNPANNPYRVAGML